MYANEWKIMKGNRGEGPGGNGMTTYSNVREES